MSGLDQATFDKWREQARRDDWHRTFVGSDIRQMLAEIESLNVKLAECERRHGTLIEQLRALLEEP